MHECSILSFFVARVCLRFCGDVASLRMAWIALKTVIGVDSISTWKRAFTARQRTCACAAASHATALWICVECRLRFGTGLQTFYKINSFQYAVRFSLLVVDLLCCLSFYFLK